jgi:multidrug efflux system membrane fusion protein
MKILNPKTKPMFVNRLLSIVGLYLVLRGALQRLRLLSLVVLASALMACSEQPPEPIETVRAIRTVTLTEPASGRMRRFSGVVEAADTSSVSFEVPGNVQEVKVDVGERISKGQVLAVLDERTFRLNVKAAEADVGRAEVELRDAQSDLERLQRIAGQDRGAISQRSLDQAEARYGSTRNNVSYNTSRLNLAKRDLERTVLRSPFDGIVSKRYVDPFQQVALGQKLFDLHMEGAMEAAISVPESEIEYIYLGLHGEVRFPAIPEQVHKGIVTEVSKVAGGANAFPVKMTIKADNPRIRPGITAEVNLLLGDEQGETAYLIPIEALAPGGSESKSYVFVFDAETSTVKKTAIESGSFRANNIVVNKGLRAGDIIAAAGVSFLRDGQKVRLSR